MRYSVKEVAELAGISVRTLHHYDAVGLLRPGTRTRAGHRRYGDEELDRLHRILVYRALGFELAAITDLLARGDDSLEHLRRQHALLLEQRTRVDHMLRGVEAMMRAKQAGVHLGPDELREVFGAFDPGEFAEEAEARWGETDVYRESRRRTVRYGKEEWLAIQAEAQAINHAFVELMQQGEEPAGTAAAAVAERHRQHISRWFYECTPEIHRGLADMYVADPRFTATYEQLAPGLAEYVSRAMLANAARRAGG